MQLFFLRHGIAEDAFNGMTDDERALTDEGRTQLEHIGAALQRLGLRPTTILHSPLVRCQQTAELLQPFIGGTLTMAYELRPGCSFDQLRRLVKDLKGKQTLIVGHAPDMGDLAARLMGAGLGVIHVKKAGLLRVDYNGKPDYGTGELRYALTPDQLVLIGNAT